MKLTIKLLLLSIPLMIFAKEETVIQLFNVQTTKVKQQSFAQSIKSYGYVQTDEERKQVISPRFGGYVVKLYANKIYKRIHKGDPLLTLYSPEVYKAKDEYLNAYKYTKTRPNKGMLESARLKLELLGVSKKEIDEVTSSKKASINTTIYSPVNGYLFTKNISKGSAFNAKSKLFEIVNLDEVWIAVKLFEYQRAKLDSIESYQLHFKGLTHVYTTSNALLYPLLDTKESTLTLRLRVKNASHKLLPGMYATVYASAKAHIELTLPRTAVIHKNGKYYVFLVGEFQGEYEPFAVDVETLDSNTYRIIKGLDEGDEVVDNALFMMDSDAQINALY